MKLLVTIKCYATNNCRGQLIQFSPVATAWFSVELRLLFCELVSTVSCMSSVFAKGSLADQAQCVNKRGSCKRGEGLM